MTGDSDKAIVFRSGLLVDGSGPERIGPVDVLVENGMVSGGVSSPHDPLEGCQFR